jgi:hypothetical protein
MFCFIVLSRRSAFRGRCRLRFRRNRAARKLRPCEGSKILIIFRSAVTFPFQNFTDYKTDASVLSLHFAGGKPMHRFCRCTLQEGNRCIGFVAALCRKKTLRQVLSLHFAGGKPCVRFDCRKLPARAEMTAPGIIFPQDTFRHRPLHPVSPQK